jgi:hypothetical protein
MEKLRQGPVLHLGVKGVDGDDDDMFFHFVLHVCQSCPHCYMFRH